ncbi:uncharacterized protein Z518_02660 [Rhinocladiella mackenziei CBS 650.93]|uniref:Plastocyanin-like domain-containing protein n=1 Tax=Rhinocladiella mackenziei CBS 650.93 TaxID=1442369 RepID=A0A0D2JFJ1_9EURO|nr:uncharacterized protein Z518_02660 [Rhinocladiella mackenziei CBS 650.93]KIX08005.1 hypothetical protein Z518_02660 [Rhinocladiella mackenziei CBS 650.93]
MAVVLRDNGGTVPKPISLWVPNSKQYQSIQELSSVEYAAGLFGAMIIYGPTNADDHEALGPVRHTDDYHAEYCDLVGHVMGTDLSKVAPYSDTNLINGQGTFDCSLVSNSTKCTLNAGYAKFHFTNGKTYRLRLINGGAEVLSIDNH